MATQTNNDALHLSVHSLTVGNSSVQLGMVLCSVDSQIAMERSRGRFPAGPLSHNDDLEHVVHAHQAE